MDAYSGNFGATRSSKVMDGRVCGVGMVFFTFFAFSSRTLSVLADFSTDATS